LAIGFSRTSSWFAARWSGRAKYAALDAALSRAEIILLHTRFKRTAGAPNSSSRAK
jgi:hypothetical protein